MKTNILKFGCLKTFQIWNLDKKKLKKMENYFIQKCYIKKEVFQPLS